MSKKLENNILGWKYVNDNSSKSDYETEHNWSGVTMTPSVTSSVTLTAGSGDTCVGIGAITGTINYSNNTKISVGSSKFGNGMTITSPGAAYSTSWRNYSKTEHVTKEFLEQEIKKIDDKYKNIINCLTNILYQNEDISYANYKIIRNMITNDNESESKNEIEINI